MLEENLESFCDGSTRSEEGKGRRRELQEVLCQISDVTILHRDDPMPLNKKNDGSFK